MSRFAIPFLVIISISAFVASYNVIGMILSTTRHRVSIRSKSTLGKAAFSSSRLRRGGRPLLGKPLPETGSESVGSDSGLDGGSAVVKRPEASSFGVKKKKRYFHTAMTCNDSPYTKWQSRIMYFYYNKYRNEPESEMGGFTRVLHSGKRDNLMDEIPTFVVDPLPLGMDKGYVVLNRPWAFVQWVQKAQIEEEYVWMAEPDHIILKPIPNLASDMLPAAFPFFYIVPKDQERFLRRWYPAEKGPITNIDPIGNSPVILKKKDLLKIAPLWHNVSLQFKEDPEIDKEFGWVLEMYGYATASAMLGYTHILRKDWMIQPPWDKSVGDAYMIHYTYGCDYDLNGNHLPGKVGPWHFDKRDHQRAIPRNLSYPPDGSAPSVFELIRRLNDATWSLNWVAGAA
ncbi:unnamed protein product [Closterium sp. Yama58-4]|nr:unnamed protein product [Closterium sp. Yama58-4]